MEPSGELAIEGESPMSITPKNKLIPSAEPEDQMAKTFPFARSVPSVRHRAFNMVMTLTLMLGFVDLVGPLAWTSCDGEIVVHRESLLTSDLIDPADRRTGGSASVPFSIFANNQRGEEGPSSQSNPKTPSEITARDGL